MKAIALTAAALAVAALSWSASPANARTCFRETVNGPGHHTMIRGCTAAHHALRTARRVVTRTTRVVTTDDYLTTPVRTRVRHRYYSYRAPREEVIEYGSSYVPPARTTYSTVYQPGYFVTCGPGTSRNWGYNYYYGSNSPPTCQASASSHPAFEGGSGQFTYHPAYGWGY